MFDNYKMPGHLARRFNQIAVSLFHAEMEAAGHDLTPVQFATLVAIEGNPGIDQITLAGMIAHDRTTITGVIDRLDRKNLVTRQVSSRDRRARLLSITDDGLSLLHAIAPAVEAAQKALVSGLTDEEAGTLMHLLTKAIDATNDRSRAPMRLATTAS